MRYNTRIKRNPAFVISSFTIKIWYISFTNDFQTVLVTVSASTYLPSGIAIKLLSAHCFCPSNSPFIWFSNNITENNPTNQSSFAMCPALGGPIGCILDVSVFTAIVLLRLVKSSSLIICFDICKQKYFIFYQQRNILIKYNKAPLFIFAEKTGTSFKCGSNYAHVTSRHVTVRKFYIYTGVVIRCSSYNWTRSTACGICISGAV